jgi:hypothetical protein
MNTADIVSKLNKIVENKQTTVLPLNSEFVTTCDEYIKSKLKFSRNQKGYSWTFRKEGNKFGVSSIPFERMTNEQCVFLQQNGSNDAKFIIDNNNIIELWLKTTDGEFVALDDDILQYKSGLAIRGKHGFNGFTFFPVQSPAQSPVQSPDNDEIKVEENIMKDDISFSDLKELVAEQKKKFSKAQVQTTKTSIPLEQKKKNCYSFINDFDNQIAKIFKNLSNKEINIAPIKNLFENMFFKLSKYFSFKS